jgi:hypothetical protein
MRVCGPVLHLRHRTCPVSNSNRQHVFDVTQLTSADNTRGCPLESLARHAGGLASPQASELHSAAPSQQAVPLPGGEQSRDRCGRRSAYKALSPSARPPRGQPSEAEGREVRMPSPGQPHFLLRGVKRVVLGRCSRVAARAVMPRVPPKPAHLKGGSTEPPGRGEWAELEE